MLERLLEDPRYARDKGYLQRAGRTQFRAGNHGASLKHWRVLLLGLERGSEDWYEAKYQQLACLREIDEKLHGVL